MKIFPHPNFHGGFTCSICKSSKDAPVVLVEIPGTESGKNIQAEQIHAECYDLFCRMNDIEQPNIEHENIQDNGI